ncbi:MAG TPA: [acyl-carrier-protein] S-malonyltransferase [Oceanospirillales bacterium]|nr:[acyl-carrier-protein] S-malonyltransferase [Oceanospirillales bacterium]|tara:strand:- start:3651 stop:4595 length:945 start_codon:yes stop_codon:yes gene_type:complete
MKQVVLYFPGQGAQQLGMLADLAEQYPIIKETFDKASKAIDQDLWSLVQNGPAEELNLTYNTQPILVTASAAIWNVIQQEVGSDIEVTAAAGHSVGEYSALYAAGILSLEDAVRLVKKRGELMDTAVPAGEGGMAAILGLDSEQIKAVCSDASSAGVVEPANFNAPGQIVIAGTAAGIAEACIVAKAAGAKRALPLQVSGPFHSSLMRQAAEPFVEALENVEWSDANFDVYHNANNAVSSVADMKQRLVEQLYSPVNWIGAVEASSKGAELAIEVGPGKVISGLNKRINKQLTTLSSGDNASFEKLLNAIKGEE